MSKVTELIQKKKIVSPDVPELTYELAEEYFEVNKQYGSFKAKRDKINKVIKELMAGITSTIVGDLSVKIVTQDKSKMNEERTVALLKEKGLINCIITKEVVNEPELEQALYRGEISQEELSTCVDPNIIPTLKVAYVKES